MHFLPSIFRDIKLIICCLLKDYSNKFSSPYYGEAEIARARNCQNGKCTTWKIPEWAMYNPEIDRKFRPWKMTENHAWKMPEWKLHTLENTRMENAQPGKYQNGNCTPWKMTEKSHPGI